MAELEKVSCSRCSCKVYEKNLSKHHESKSCKTAYEKKLNSKRSKSNEAVISGYVGGPRPPVPEQPKIQFIEPTPPMGSNVSLEEPDIIQVLNHKHREIINMANRVITEETRLQGMMEIKKMLNIIFEVNYNIYYHLLSKDSEEDEENPSRTEEN